MSVLQSIVLALIQGLTEYLPISSSAHLILLSIVTGWPDQGLFMDIAAHAGSLIAVVLYFKKDLAQLTGNVFSKQRDTCTLEGKRLVAGLVIASIPIMIAGFMLANWIETYTRSTTIMALTSIVFGLLLWWADWRCRGKETEYQLSITKMLFIGCAQALALVPGTSRSGITITAGLMVGMSPVAASRFSFLLAIPAIIMAAGYKTLQIVNSDTLIDWSSAMIIFSLSAVTAYACIHYFLKFVNHVGMLPFVVYRLLLGMILLLFFA